MGVSGDRKFSKAVKSKLVRRLTPTNAELLFYKHAQIAANS
jgi:hypothetical protein